MSYHSQWSDAKAVIEGWKADGKTIVFSNGCFDLLHPGHIDYLSKARALGDRLVIGLNDDDSISRLKGPSRPICSLAVREVMLAALQSVDLVVPFSEDTPLELIKTLQPDLLVKGGDYQPDDIVGAKEVRKNGGHVTVISFLEGHSTTSLINHIQKTG